MRQELNERKLTFICSVKRRKNEKPVRFLSVRKKYGMQLDSSQEKMQRASSFIHFQFCEHAFIELLAGFRVISPMIS